jgi:hypothetical protein
LFSTLEYIDDINTQVPNSLVKASKPIEREILKKVSVNKQLLFRLKPSGFPIFFHNAPRYFIRVMDRAPYFYNEKDGEKVSTQVKQLLFGSKEEAHCIGAALNSSLYYWWFVLFSDSRHLNSREIEHFNFEPSKKIAPLLAHEFTVVNEDFERNKYRKETFYKATGQVIYDEYYPKLSKEVIDNTDLILAKHYGFTHAELDFIINYDIKYRMGKELGGGEEE